MKIIEGENFLISGGERGCSQQENVKCFRMPAFEYGPDIPLIKPFLERGMQTEETIPVENRIVCDTETQTPMIIDEINLIEEEEDFCMQHMGKM